jgi:myo-inositol 2-dehydrogenase/D-chiro-inositol 1-dehydrogenase
MKANRIGIIGCGRAGREHARSSTFLGARVALLCDPDISRARTLAAEYPGSVVLPDVQSIEWSSIDALFVCTPPAARGPAELAAVQAGIPIMLEKPVGLSAEGCRPLLKALIEKPVINSVGYMNRYRDSVINTQQLFQHAELVGIVCNWVGGIYRVPWWLQRNASGGPFNEQGTHLVDLCRLFLGEVTDVFAMAANSSIHKDIQETVAVTLRFSNEKLATIFYSYRASEKHIHFQIFSTTHSVSLEGWDLKVTAKGASMDAITSIEEDIYLKEDAAFFNAISTGDRSLIKSPLQDAIRTQLVVDAIHRSLLSQKPEQVPIFDSNYFAAADYENLESIR